MDIPIAHANTRHGRSNLHVSRGNLVSQFPSHPYILEIDVFGSSCSMRSTGSFDDPIPQPS